MIVIIVWVEQQVQHLCLLDAARILILLRQILVLSFLKFGKRCDRVNALILTLTHDISITTIRKVWSVPYDYIAIACRGSSRVVNNNVFKTH